MHLPAKRAAIRPGFSLTSMALLVALSAVSLLVAAPGAASASAQASRSTDRFASLATSYQNRTIDHLLAINPGSRRISATEILVGRGIIVAVPSSATARVHSLALGRHIVTASASAPACYSGSFCGWTRANFTGTEALYPKLTGFWAYGVDGLVTHSWYNDTLYRAWREQFQNRGNELCINPWPNGENSDYNGVNYDDYWLLMSSNPNNC